MKKLWCLTLIGLMMAIQPAVIRGGEYLTYQDIAFVNDDVRLLRQFQSWHFDVYYDRLAGRRFWGWRTYTAHDHEPVRFRKETLYVIENAGTSPVHKTYFFETTYASKYQVSATGNIGTSTSGDIRSFRLNLDAEIDVRHTRERSHTQSEHVEIRLQVDPATRLRVEVYGEGLLTNGVARYYRFWRNVRSGGWEVFLVTTEYFSIVKEEIHVRPSR